MATPLLRVRIISPQQVILDTKAISVSSKNSQGTFDILPLHANFMTVIENHPIIIRPLISEQQKQEKLTFNFPVAIIYNSLNTVNIYTYLQPDQEKN